MPQYKPFPFSKINHEAGVESVASATDNGLDIVITIAERPNATFRTNLTIEEGTTTANRAVSAWVSSQTTTSITVQVRLIRTVAITDDLGDIEIYWEVYDG